LIIGQDYLIQVQELQEVAVQELEQAREQVRVLELRVSELEMALDLARAKAMVQG
jgi:hypothetical protein